MHGLPCLLFRIPYIPLAQAIVALGNCNPSISMDPLTGIYTASPKHLGFRLYINMSYAALAATPGAEIMMGSRLLEPVFFFATGTVGPQNASTNSWSRDCQYTRRPSPHARPFRSS